MDVKSVFGSTIFSIFDFIVVGISLALILLCSVFHACFTGNKYQDDFLLGGRTMRKSQIAVSLAMLYVPVLHIIEGPANIYYYGIESFMTSILAVVIIPIGAFLFVPMFHRMELTSIHQYLGFRFDSLFLRRLTSGAFIIQETFFTCVVLGVVSITLEKYFQIPMLTSICSIGAFTLINTTLGGFKAVVWTQIYQFTWFVTLLTLLVVISMVKAGGFSRAFDLAEKNGRLDLFNLQLNPFMQHNFFNFVIGYGFMILMHVATCQPFLQRFSSVPTKSDAVKSVLLSIPFQVVPSLLCLFLGIFLHATYAGCDPLKFTKINEPKDLVHHFVRNITSVPGIVGFFIACFIGGAISVCSTSVNAITACLHKDFISKMNCCKPSSPVEETSCTCRFISLTFTAMCTTITSLVVIYADIETYQAFLSTFTLIMLKSVFYGPLAAVFLMGMFFPCINKYGASVGFIGGMICLGYIVHAKLSSISSIIVTAPLNPAMGNCTDSNGFNLTDVIPYLPWHSKYGDSKVEKIETMSLTHEDIPTMSYLLLTLTGAICSIIIAFPVSILTGGLCVCAARKIQAKALHPMLSFSDCCIDSSERQLTHALSHKHVDRIASVHNVYPNGGKKLDDQPPNYQYSRVPESP